MRKNKKQKINNQLWAEFRFSIIGRLFSDPPKSGKLRGEIRALSSKVWIHPITGENVKYAYKTIEEWYYKAKNNSNPIESLRQVVRSDIGKNRRLTDKEKQYLINQYNEYKSWSYKLHADNFNAYMEKHPEVGEKCPYRTILRFMKSGGFFKIKSTKNSMRPNAKKAAEIREKREIRSYEMEYVNALWHLDFHHGSRQVVNEKGIWETPILLCILDDCSRIICHIQWFMHEDTKTLVHGLMQAFQKRGLPRAILSDNGSAMISVEYVQGLSRLSIEYDTTLEYSPYQNGKQECIWGTVEGRLMEMFKNYKRLDLKLLNDATQAWAEMEYNRTLHSEINQKPIDRFLNHKSVNRPCPQWQDLKKAFMKEEMRKQRRSDGTVSIDGKRFEIPGRYRHVQEISVRYARWNLSEVYITDRRTGKVICRIYPVNKVFNSEGKRRSLEPISPTNEEMTSEDKLPPLLEKLISDYSATGLPPAYIPTQEEEDNDGK